jgi:hypothetical protein
MKQRRTVTSGLLWFAGLGAAGYFGAIAILFCIVNVATHSRGCSIDEGNAHSCVMLGMDMGDVLYNFSALLQILVVLLPAFLLAIGGAVVLAAGAWLWFRFTHRRH